MRIFFILILIFINLYAGKIIVNVQNPVSALSSELIREIFNLKRLTWERGDHIQVYMLPSSSQSQNSFTDTYLFMDSREVHEQWMKYVLNGGMNKPPIFMNERRLIKQIVKNVNAIGIVSDNVTLPKTLKVIHIFSEKE